MHLKSGAIIALSLCLLLSVTLNIVQLVSRGREYQNIVGTYCTGNGMVETDEYLVFERNGAYSRYRQFQMLERGGYTARGESVYILTSADGTNTIQILYKDKAVYQFEELRITIFKQLSDTPTYINVNENAGE